MLSALGVVVNKGNLGALQEITDETYQAFAGRQDQFADLIPRLSELTAGLNRQVNDIIDRIHTRLDLPQLHPHTLRHLRCTMLKRGGIPLDDIALFAGHASVASTQLYLHLAPQELAQRLREATAPFDGLLARLITEHLDGHTS